MKSTIKRILILSIWVLMAQQVALGSEEATKSVPVAEVVNAKYAFETAVEGSEVVHDFIIKNTGTAPLHIEKVKTGWGCSAASYTKQIPPGEEGKVTIKVRTSGYGGRKINKTIWVHTDDPATPKQKLMISGFVEKIVDIQPKGLVRLVGKVGEPIKKTVTIVPEKKYPFQITEAKAQKGEDISFEFKEAASDQPGYVVTIENIKTGPGRYFDTIALTTTSALMPKITLRVFGDIKDPDLNKNRNKTNEPN